MPNEAGLSNLDHERTPLLAQAARGTAVDSTRSPGVLLDEEAGLTSTSHENNRAPSICDTCSSSVAGVISLLLVGVFVANSEGSLVVASFGHIASEFNDLENGSWLLTSYVLAMAVAQPMYGKLSNIFGHARMLLVAYTFFGVGCAMGQSLLVVVAGRVVSGLGGADMGSLMSIMITDLVPVRDVGVWRSYVGVVATVGRASGGPIGGYLTDTIGWRWSFLGQCSPTVLSILLTWLLVPNRVGPSTDESMLTKLSRIDFIGSLLLGSGILAFLLPLELAGTSLSWTHPLNYLLFIASGALGAVYFLVEAYWAKEPIMSPSMLLSWDVFMSNTIMFCQVAAQLGMMSTVPLYFQVTQNTSATVAGAHLLPAVAGVTVGGLLGGWSGRYFGLLVFATICSSSCHLLLMLRWGTAIKPWEALYIIPGGFGNGLILSTAFVALTARISKEDMAMACSGFYLTYDTATAVGMATTSAVLQGVLKSGLPTELRDYPQKDAVC
ncbi:Uu.00g012990.m01.CDS01 [Anthostomella pinea]|uniref:Uu.00g012990.m01.CDS01 n=1 Tax=Anthostomella pinea TaxID=933095 RepID=A0AAI8VYN2_9PEZI|nr:Uu.00g012990.m01.CDS01 [Anthostomella pinea]